ncbi:hypothetical protein R1sor_004324 [Riccia sorocarpa]|uniref:F-box domain-containing protein n=1 Tax=Riccia sorocarpa TaxID=122646 RepID=A0ABD3HH05_9MARC
MSGFAAGAVLGASSSSTSIPQSRTQREVWFTLNLPVDVLMVEFLNLTPRELARLSVWRSFSDAAKSDQLWRRRLPPNMENLAEKAYGRLAWPGGEAVDVDAGGEICPWVFQQGDLMPSGDLLLLSLMSTMLVEVS